MGKVITGKDKVCMDICNALGLKAESTMSLDLHMRYNAIVTVVVEFYPDAEVLDKLVPILAEYELIKRKRKLKMWVASQGGAIPKFAMDGYDGTHSPLSTVDISLARRFVTEEDCQKWIDSWESSEMDKLGSWPVWYEFEED